jgi:hypothetical protein
MKNATDALTFRDLHGHRGVLDLDYLPEQRPGDAQCRPKDVRLGFPKWTKLEDMNKSTKPQFETVSIPTMRLLMSASQAFL